jgi:pimeloyl-ACP methyl ester carboxylesterase
MLEILHIYKMKLSHSFILCLLLLFCVVNTSAQNVVSGEYWFDEDHVNKQTLGAYNASIINTGQLSISTNGLGPGTHTINIRFKDASGYWGVPVRQQFKRVGVVAYQYWLDDDVNNMSAVIPISSNQQNKTIIDLVTTSTLPAGVHSVNYRIKDGDGFWSAPMRHQFTKAKGAMAKYQYWFDEDMGAAQTFPITGNQFYFDGIPLVPTTNVPFGEHSITVRFQDADGLWSIAHTKPFRRINLISYEYWFDDNYSTRSNYNFTGPTTYAENITNNINVSQLGPGMHRLHYRVRNGDGYYSNTINALIVVHQQLSKIEYWYDNDFASKKIIYGITPNQDFIQIPPYTTISTNTLEGDIHKLHFRCQSIDGSWSNVTTNLFNKDNSKLVGVEYWYNGNRTQKFTDYFTEREFVEIGPIIDPSVAPAGSTLLYYRFLDNTGKWSSVETSTFINGNNYTANIPIVFTNKSSYSFGSTINITGELFTPNCKVSLQISELGGLIPYSIEIMADANGNINTIYFPSTQYGKREFIITAKDNCSKIAAQETKFFVGVDLEEKLFVKTKLDGQEFSYNDVIKLTWQDFIRNAKDDNQVLIPLQGAKREYNYKIEYLNNNNQWVFLNAKKGFALLNNYLTISIDLTGNAFVNASNTKLRVVDLYKHSNADETAEFIINPINPDYSISLLHDNNFYNSTKKIIGCAADGVSRLLLRVETPNVSNVISSVDFSLSDASNTSALNYLGKLKEATNVNSATAEASTATSNNITVTIPSVSNNGKYYAWYLSPEDFAEPNGQDLAIRFVKVKAVIHFVNNAPDVVVYKTINIIRPPLVFVHGFMSNKSAFSKLNTSTGDYKTTNFGNDPRYEESVVDYYTIDAFASFDENSKYLLGINTSVYNKQNGPSSNFISTLTKVHKKGYACNQVDYVGHSMGGSVIRNAINNFQGSYLIPQNYGRGYIHKLVTVNTPHHGSPLADLGNLFTEKLDTYLLDLLVVGCAAGKLKQGLDILYPTYNRQLNYNLDLNFFNLRSTSQYQCVDPDLFKWMEYFAKKVAGNNAIVPLVNSLSLKLELSEAMQNLRVDPNEGKRFGFTSVKAHLIGSDFIKKYNNQPLTGLMEFGVPPDVWSAINLEEYEYFEWIVDLCSKLYDASKPGPTKELLKKVTKGANKPKGVQDIFEALDVLQTIYAGSVISSDIIAMLPDCDIAVPLKSQLAGIAYDPVAQASTKVDRTGNVTVFEGSDYWHLNITDKTDVADWIMHLMNADLNDTDKDYFKDIPSHPLGPSTPSANSSSLLVNNNYLPSAINNSNLTLSNFLDSLDFSRIKYKYDSVLVNANFVDNQVFNVDSTYMIVVNISDTVNMVYVELKYQDQQVKKYLTRNHVTFEMPININKLDTSVMQVKVYYDYPDSAVYYTYTKQVVFHNNINPLAIHAESNTYNVNPGIMVNPKILVIDSLHNTSLTLWNRDFIVSVADTNIVKFNPNRRLYETIADGETYSIINYKGVLDTIYFSIGLDEMIEDTTTSIKIASQKPSFCAADSMKLFINNINCPTQPFFQWYLNNTIIPTQTSDTLKMFNLVQSDSVYCVMTYYVDSVLYTISSNKIQVNVFPVFAANKMVDSIHCPNGADGSITINPVGGNTPYHYLWSTTDTTNSIDSLGIGMYTCIITDSNGCKIMDTTNMEVSQIPLPIASITSNPINSIICNGKPIALNGAGGTIVSWSGGITNGSNFIPTSTASYSVTVANSNGCTATASRLVTVNPNPSVSINSTPLYANLCLADSIKLSGVGATSYAWSGGITNNIKFAPAITTIYTVTGTNTFGCSNTSSKTIYVSNCNGCLSNVVISNTPYTPLLTESSNWIKTNGTVKILKETGVRLDASPTGYVLLQPGFMAESGSVFVAQAFNGCVAGSPNRAIMPTDTAVVAPTIAIYPNPTNAIIHIETNIGHQTIRILDAVGKVYKIVTTENSLFTAIDMSELPVGVYFVKVDNFETIKVVKE